MEDPTFLEDQIREMNEEVARLSRQQASEAGHVAKARQENEQAVEQLEASTVSVALAEVSSQQLASGTSTGRMESRRERDNRLLKDCKDTVALAERVLELKLLDREHDRSVSDAKECAAEWKQRLEEASASVNRVRAELAAVPPSERGDLVSTAEKYTDVQTQKRKLMAELDDERRTHGDKKITREEQVQRMQETLAQLDVKLGQTRSDTRRIEREQHSYTARIESLEEQREEYRQRLQEYAGNDDLLRVSFKRYDTDGSGSLDANEIFAATQEILAIRYVPFFVLFFFHSLL
jgi:TolA-binding protein